jgi:hypothetical protein
MDLLDWFALAISIFNGIAFAFVLWATAEGLNPRWAVWITQREELGLGFPVMSLIALVSVWVGAVLVPGRARTTIPDRPAAKLPWRLGRRLERLSWGLLLGAVTSYWVYAHAYGGFGELLHYTGLIRTARLATTGISNTWSFLQRFGGLAIFSSFLFFGLVLSPIRTRSRVRCVVGLAMSSVVAVYVLYSWGGRLALLVYATTFVLGYFFWRHGATYRMLLRGLGVLLVMVLMTPLVTRWVDPEKGAATLAELAAKELSFPVVAYAASLEGDEERWMQDILVAPVYLLPKRVWSGALGLRSASEDNTLRIMGALKGEDGVTGGIPVDFVTFGYLQGWALGVAIWGILWGAFLKWLSSWLDRIPMSGIRAPLYAFAVISISAMTVLYSDPVHIIERNIHFIIGGVALTLALLPWRRRREEPQGSGHRYGSAPIDRTGEATSAGAFRNEPTSAASGGDMSK